MIGGVGGGCERERRKTSISKDGVENNDKQRLDEYRGADG